MDTSNNIILSKWSIINECINFTNTLNISSRDTRKLVDCYIILNFTIINFNKLKNTYENLSIDYGGPYATDTNELFSNVLKTFLYLCYLH